MSLKRHAGFTLIELLIVIVILGLLASLVAPEMFSKVDSSKRKTAATQMKMLQTSIDAFRLDTGRVPAALAELTKSDVRGWDGPYLPKEVPLDPWGTPYVYTVPGKDGALYEMRSYAADAKEGGEGDSEDIVLQ